MKKLTHSEFSEMLANRKGAIILSIKANTDARLLKTGNPHGEVRKETYTRVVTGANYEDAVKRQGGEGFKAAELPYGEFEIKNKIIKTDDGKLQLRTQARNPRPPISVRFIRQADMVELAQELVRPYMQKKSESKRQAAVGVKGKKQVKIRNFDLDNIKEVAIKGERFQLVAD